MQDRLTEMYFFAYRKQRRCEEIMKKKILIGAIVLGSMGVLTGCGKTEIDLSEYIKIEYEGVDTKGYVMDYSLDRDKLEKALKEGNGDMSNKEREGLMDSIELEIKGDTSELSNGDKIKVDIDWSNRRAEKFKIEFTTDEAEFKVKGLKTLKKVDAFKDIEVEYEGVSPFLDINVESNSDIDFLDDAYYSVEGPNDNIRVGDEVEITVDYSEYDAEEDGYTVEETTSKMTVEGDDIDAYVEKVEEINEEALTSLTEEAKAMLQEKIFDRVYTYGNVMNELFDLTYAWDFDSSTISRTSADGSGFKVDKVAVYTAEDAEDYIYSQDRYNQVTVVLESQIQDSVCTNPVTVYFSVDFDGVILKADGTLEYEDYNVDVKYYAKTLDEITAKYTEDMDDYSVVEKTY